jgi:hypothetical protein
MMIRVADQCQFNARYITPINVKMISCEATKKPK